MKSGRDWQRPGEAFANTVPTADRRKIMYKKIDANQKMIVSALRYAGARVCSLAALGRGCPDLLVGWRGVNYLVEVKNREGRGDRLTPDEDAFIKCWRGQVVIVFTVDNALALLGVE